MPLFATSSSRSFFDSTNAGYKTPTPNATASAVGIAVAVLRKPTSWVEKRIPAIIGSTLASPIDKIEKIEVYFRKDATSALFLEKLNGTKTCWLRVASSKTSRSNAATAARRVAYNGPREPSPD